MQRSSAIPTVGVKSLDWFIAPRCGVIPAQDVPLGYPNPQQERVGHSPFLNDPV
jgi:hypothetical protein